MIGTVAWSRTMASIFAPRAPNPFEFRSLHADLDQSLDAFDKPLDAPSKGDIFPVPFGAGLSPANANLGVARTAKSPRSAFVSRPLASAWHAGRDTGGESSRPQSSLSALRVPRSFQKSSMIGRILNDTTALPTLPFIVPRSETVAVPDRFGAV